MAINQVSDALSAAKGLEESLASREDFGSANHQLTLGPEDNTLSGDYRAGDGVWNIHFCADITADILLIYQAKLAQMYRAVRSPNLSAPIPRAIKDLLIKERFPLSVG